MAEAKKELYEVSLVYGETYFVFDHKHEAKYSPAVVELTKEQADYLKNAKQVVNNADGEAVEHQVFKVKAKK